MPIDVPWLLLHTAQRASFVLDFTNLNKTLPTTMANSPSVYFRVVAVNSTYPLGSCGNYGFGEAYKCLNTLFRGVITLPLTAAAALRGMSQNQTATPTYSVSAIPMSSLPVRDQNLLDAKPVPSFAVPRPQYVMNYDIVFNTTSSGVNLAFVDGYTLPDSLAIPPEPLLFRLMDFSASDVATPLPTVSQRAPHPGTL